MSFSLSNLKHNLQDNQKVLFKAIVEGSFCRGVTIHRFDLTRDILGCHDRLRQLFTNKFRERTISRQTATE